MSCKHGLYTRLVVISVVLAMGLLAGCAAKKYVMVEKPKGITLEYRMPEGEVLRYTTSQQTTQTMEPMGMPLETVMTKSYELSLKPEGREGEAYEVEITVDAMDAGAKTVQGEFSADVDSVIGKSFGMSMSRLGKVLDVSEAEAIQYGIGPQGTRSIKADFEFMFPRLAEMPLSIGDTWTTRDTVSMIEGGIEILIISEGINTLKAIEPMAGFDCAVVETQVAGEVRGEGEQQGAKVGFEGTITGTETWYFAYQQGIFVENSSNIYTNGSISVSGPSEMTFPMTERASSKVSLVK
jgi:hypothetical protein